jgi:hypothetical protein
MNNHFRTAPHLQAHQIQSKAVSSTAVANNVKYSTSYKKKLYKLTSVVYICASMTTRSLASNLELEH